MVVFQLTRSGTGLARVLRSFTDPGVILPGIGYPIFLVRVRIGYHTNRCCIFIRRLKARIFHSKLVILIMKMMDSKCYKPKLCGNRIARVLESIQALENIHFKNAFKFFGAISNQNKLICTIIILIILRKNAREI